jgi:hypothetical protein
MSFKYLPGDSGDEWAPAFLLMLLLLVLLLEEDQSQ